MSEAMRPRKTTSTKVITGQFRADRALDLPRFSAAVPKAPAGLSPAARKHWRELARELSTRRTMTTGDRQILVLCCSALGQYDEAMAVLAERGPTYETVTAAGSVLRRAQPEVRMAADAWGRALQGLVQLGLTPRSRGNVEIGR